MELIPRFFQPPKHSYFLFGPRGTGKSTLVKNAYTNFQLIDLLEPETFRILSANPERMKEVIEANRENNVVIIDEIQKVPELLALIHNMIEKKRDWQFVLTGSSSRKLKRTGVDLLAGRALLCTLHPFMASELGERFDLPNALKHGLLPIVVDSDTPDQVLKTYIALYLREEVQLEGLVRNIGSFSRFLEAISFSHASLLNISNVSRECQVERKTVEGFVSVLEDLLLCFKLQVFSKKAKRALVSHPKFYLFDCGVYRSLRPKGPFDRPTEIEGHALEGLVAQHLRAWIDYSNSDAQLYFWRTRAGSEVDFVLYGSQGIIAIEVKHSNRIHPKDLTHLKAFKKDYPIAQTYLLYRGKERLLIQDILCLPCQEFLCQLLPKKWPIF